MKIFTETNRLVLREIELSDAPDLFKLDSDPLVNKYLGSKPIQTIQQAKDIIGFIRQQYQDNGIGRWAVIEKRSGAFIGWSGLKLEKDIRSTPYYDLGYRFMPRFWGKGFATESAIASLKYGFETLEYQEICAAAHVDNDASNAILRKVGMVQLEKFVFEKEPHNWYQLKSEVWRKNQFSYI